MQTTSVRPSSNRKDINNNIYIIDLHETEFEKCTFRQSQKQVVSRNSKELKYRMMNVINNFICLFIVTIYMCWLMSNR